jgi:hypothetical protein
MNEIGIQGISPRPFIKTTRDDTDPEISPNILMDEGIEVIGMDQVWLSDMTFIPPRRVGSCYALCWHNFDRFFLLKRS